MENPDSPDTVELKVLNALHHLHIRQQHKLLLGVSGGIDSMTMLYLLSHLGFDISVAHVNFKLRGRESDDDAFLVLNWCEAQNIRTFLLEEDTKAYAAIAKLSTQEAARKIRYDWWKKLKAEHHFQYILTAHNLDDHIETMFLHLLRGTGFKGLLGIPLHFDGTARPLLSISRHEIEAYAKAHEIPYRTDSSNLHDEYFRNRIRHHLIPAMKELNDGFESRMQHNLYRFNVEWNAWQAAFQDWYDHHVNQIGDDYQIRYEPKYTGFLVHWLEGKNIPWNLAMDFISSVAKDTGKTLQYEQLRLSRTENGFFLEKIKPQDAVQIPQEGIYMQDYFKFSIQQIQRDGIEWTPEATVEYVSGDAVLFPLELRPVSPGDSFQPLGMQGRQKKIQDLLVDRKLEMHEKTKVRLLTSGHQIIWVTGIQLDERARVKDHDTKVYKLTFERLEE